MFRALLLHVQTFISFMVGSLQKTLHYCSKQMSCFMRKAAFCICKNKGADQLLSDGPADRHLYFCYKDSTILSFLHLKFQDSSVVLQPSLCWTWWETLKTSFLMTRLKYVLTFPCTCIYQSCHPHRHSHTDSHLSTSGQADIAEFYTHTPLKVKKDEVWNLHDKIYSITLII